MCEVWPQVLRRPHRPAPVHLHPPAEHGSNERESQWNEGRYASGTSRARSSNRHGCGHDDVVPTVPAVHPSGRWRSCSGGPSSDEISLDVGGLVQDVKAEDGWHQRSIATEHRVDEATAHPAS